MILHQFYLGCLAHASYLIGDEVTGTAWVVDPQRDVEPYLVFARDHGLRITDVVLTHIHADFVAGHRELRDRCGAVIHLGPDAKAAFTHRSEADGATYQVGQVRLRFLHTPGHTPEGISLVVHDCAQPGEPAAAVLTGDTLFVGDVGRPDLLAAVGADPVVLAGQLQESLGKLLQLPDDCLVYPAHGAGSLCGRSLGATNQSTIGQERRSNYALQPMDRASFVAAVTADQPPAPAYFAHDVAANRADLPSLVATLVDLDWAGWTAAVAAGAQVLDVRDGASFAGGHLPGAINVGLRGQFATWAGAVLDPARPVALIADTAEQADEAALRLRRIGFDALAGSLRGGMASVPPSTTINRLPRLAAIDLAAEQSGAHPPVVVDVRQSSEYAAGHIPGAMLIPLAELPKRWRELAGHARVVVHCAGGYRSLVAASLLRSHGLLAEDLLGGYQAWVRATAPAAALANH